MIGECFGEKGISSRGMYIQSIADIPKLYTIGLKEEHKYGFPTILQP
ncbi:MAG: hypothetical protein WBC40_01060 [Halobacteriota archaeon]